jgi:trimethylamine corrinoid protein
MMFAEKADEVNADIIALSALMTTTMPYQEEVLKVLNEMNLKKRFKVIVGGGPTSQKWADEIGADGWAPDAPGAVTLVRSML